MLEGDAVWALSFLLTMLEHPETSIYLWSHHEQLSIRKGNNAN